MNRKKFFRKLFVRVGIVVLNESTVEDNSVLPAQVCICSFIVKDLLLGEIL